MFKENQIDIPDHQYYLACNAKKMVHLTFLEKKLVFQTEMLTFSRILFSKKWNFSRVKELLKIEPNWYPRLPVQFRLLCKKYGPPNLPRKKVGISIGSIDLFTYSIFKNIEILSGQGVVQSEPN